MSTTITKHGFHDEHDEEGNWHIIPDVEGKDFHITDKRHECICEPRVLLDVDRRIYIHAAEDGRA